MSLPAELETLIQGASLTSSFVVNELGEVATTSGSSHGIGNQSDKLLLRALRANSEIVLTSGKTARADDYRMPRTADLAIFTDKGVGDLELKPKTNQRLHIFGSREATGFESALHYTKQLGYQRIHVEFGPTGFRQIQTHLELVLLSTVRGNGIDLFARDFDLRPRATFELENLMVWAC